jgi:hypothetical protein
VPFSPLHFPAHFLSTTGRYISAHLLIAGLFAGYDKHRRKGETLSLPVYGFTTDVPEKSKDRQAMGLSLYIKIYREAKAVLRRVWAWYRPLTDADTSQGKESQRRPDGSTLTAMPA